MKFLQELLTRNNASLKLKKLQEAENILISWISIELESFFLIALG